MSERAATTELRRRRFAQEYSIHHNGTKAAVDAGYAPSSAKVTAARLLARPDVQAMIRELDEDKRARLGWDADKVVVELGRIYARCMEGSPKFSRDTPLYHPETGDLVVDWHPTSAIRALEALAKILGLFDRVEEEVATVFTLHAVRDLETEADEEATG